MSLGQATHGQLICAYYYYYYYYYYLRRPLRRTLLPDRSGFARSASARREGVAAAGTSFMKPLGLGLGLG